MSNEWLEKSYGKLNLHLEVTAIRSDGYHTLQTLFVPISLYDTIAFKKAAQPFRFSCNLPDLEREDNLIVQAYHQMMSFVPSVESGCHIHLEKNIPMGAGLGGGSSNAATTLKGLMHLFQLSIEPDRIFQMARSLGADVPFFLQSKPAIGEGIGDELTPFDLQDPLYFLVCTPPVPIATKWAYQQLDGTTYTPRIFEHQVLIKALSSKEEEYPASIFINRFEDVVCLEYPIIRTLLDWLQSQEDVEVAHLTGSGSSVYALVKQSDVIMPLLTKINQRFPNIACVSATYNPQPFN